MWLTRCAPARLVTLAILLATTGVSTAAAQTVVRLDRPAPIDAYGGWLAWSERDVTGTFRLKLRDPVGNVTTPPVAGRATSFDVDLGPGPAGGVVAAYSRCAEEVGSSGGFLPADYDEGRGCDAYLYDLAAVTERKLDGLSVDQADETWPTVWRDRVGFVRSYDRKPDLPYLYVRPLAGGRSERMPGGSRNQCWRNNQGRLHCTDRRVSRPYALDLYGRRLAFGWTYAGNREGLDTMIRMDTIGGGHGKIAFQGGGGLTGRAMGWPSVDNGRIYFSNACYADTSGCVGEPELHRYRISTRGMESAQGPKAILGHARDRGTTFLLVDEAPGTGCQGDPAVPGGTCFLRAVPAQYR